MPEKFRSDSAGIARSSQDDLRTTVLAEAGDTTASSPALELGNLTWAMHNVWLRYRHTMDKRLLKNVLFPVLRRAVNYLLHNVSEGADGKIHLPRTYSPEYAFADDCNYNLALLNWGCRTLLQAAKILKIADPLIPTWQDTINRMVDPPQDATGLRIGANRALTSSHRHYSHLLWFYPLYLLDVTEPQNRELLERSLKHWVSFTGALQGYTFTGASSMSSMLGKGDDALDYLNTLLDKYVRPNTMYAETGPVIETPLSGAQSVHDMMIPSWGDRIRVFPGAPSAWADITIHRLRTEGAFDVSAVREGGTTQWVYVHSHAGEPCRIEPGNLPRPWAISPVKGSRPVDYRINGGLVTLQLKAGQGAIIHPVNARPAPAVIKPVEAGTYSWGRPALVVGASTPVPLDDAFNHDAITTEENQADGNLGSGYTLPDEQLPAAGGFESSGIKFVFPSAADGAKNNIAPAGQKVAIPAGKYVRFHALGLSVSGGSTTTVTATYADGSTAALSLKLSDWGRAAAYGEEIAVLTDHRHYTGGTSTLAVRIFHQWVELDAAKELVSLTFGTNSRAHVFALSVEQPK